MAYKKTSNFKFFISDIAGELPLVAKLEYGQLYLNTADKKMYSVVLNTGTRALEYVLMFAYGGGPVNDEQWDALNLANNPSGDNPIATMSDVEDNAAIASTEIVTSEEGVVLIDWSLGKFLHVDDVFGNDLVDVNLPVFPLVKEILVRINTGFISSWPSYWRDYNRPSGEDYNMLRLTCFGHTPNKGVYRFTLGGSIGMATLTPIGNVIITPGQSAAGAAADYVSAYAAAALVDGWILTADEETITFTQAEFGYNIPVMSAEQFAVDPGDLDGIVSNEVPNTEAEKQVDTVTLSGTDGSVDISITGMTTKRATFDTSLTITASNFVTANAAYYLTQGIVLTSYTADLIFTAAVAGTGFDSPVATPVIFTLDGSVTVDNENVPAVKQKEVVTLSGTSGMAIITGAGGIMNAVVFNSTLSQTATDFVTNQAADYLAEGIVITADSGDIVFEAETEGVPFTAPVITNDTGNLSGTVDHDTANVEAEAQIERITLTGDLGTAVVDINGDEYHVEFDTDLATTAANFVTDNAADLLADSAVVATADGGEIVLTANVAGVAFVSPTITPDTNLYLEGSVANTAINVEAVAQVEEILLTGQTGQAEISAFGAANIVQVPIDGILTNAAENFVAAHASAALEEGIIITSGTSKIIFTASNPGSDFAQPTIANVASNIEAFYDDSDAFVPPIVFWECIQTSP